MLKKGLFLCPVNLFELFRRHNKAESRLGLFARRFETMKQGFLSWGLALAFLGTLAAGCNIFSPQSSKATIEVSNTLGGSSCNLQANLDGGPTATIGNGSVYTFPSVSSGSHTVNLTAGGGCSGPACEFQNSSLSYSDNFQANAGDLYVVKVSQGAACQNMVVSGP